MVYCAFAKKIVIFSVVALFIVLSNNCFASEIVTSPRDNEFMLSTKNTFEYFCAPCHGPKGDGKGTFYTYGLEPTPRDFTDTDYMSKRTDADLIKSITSGSQSVGLSNMCPQWGKTFTEKKITELASYIRKFSVQEEQGVKEAVEEEVAKEEETSTFKTAFRWLFLVVVTIALAGGAASEWKKLKRESKK